MDFKNPRNNLPGESWDPPSGPLKMIKSAHPITVQQSSKDHCTPLGTEGPVADIEAFMLGSLCSYCHVEVVRLRLVSNGQPALPPRLLYRLAFLVVSKQIC